MFAKNCFFFKQQPIFFSSTPIKINQQKEKRLIIKRLTIGSLHPFFAVKEIKNDNFLEGKLALKTIKQKNH